MLLLTGPLAGSGVAAPRAGVLLVVVAGATATRAQSVRLVAALTYAYIAKEDQPFMPSCSRKLLLEQKAAANLPKLPVPLPFFPILRS